MQPLTSINADSVLTGMTVALASIGCGLPKVIASDQGSQIIKMGDVMGEAQLDNMSDVEYNRLKFQLVRQGVVLRETTSLLPWKQGKCERLIKILKGAIKMHGMKNSSYTEFVQLVSKCEVLINCHPLGSYKGVWGDTIL